jgi:hypothetical protein
MNISISIKEAQILKPGFCHLSEKTSEKITDRSLKMEILPRISPPRKIPILDGGRAKKGRFTQEMAMNWPI